MKVFIVISRWGEETDIESVWSDENKAIAERNLLNEENEDKPHSEQADCYSYEEYEVDPT